MKHVVVPYTVKLESLEIVKHMVRKFISAIKENEPETLVYKSLQQMEEPTKFIHIMTFSNSAAEEYHRQTEHCKEFVTALYPCCETKPRAIVYTEIN